MGIFSRIHRAAPPPPPPPPPPPQPVAPPAPIVNSRRQLFSPAALAELQLGAFGQPRDTYRRPEHPAWVERWLNSHPERTLAMDSVDWDGAADYAQSSSAWTEGLGFMGYAYLAELWQRSEYRRISEIWAAECTRKWIRLKGGDPKRVAALEDALRRYGVREKMREAIELDGGFGRSHIFLDFGERPGERGGRIEFTPETVPVDSLRNLKVVEAYWTYPLNFNAQDPLADDFYAPNQWLVMGDAVHNSRMLTFVGREVPDILKPVYLFGGVSMAQMAKPYIDNFIRNRTSVANLLFSFSTMVLSTNMTAMLSPEGAGELIRRIQSFVLGRDNGGVMVVDKDTEALANVSAPLSGTHELLAQSQEFIASVTGIPLVVLLGVTPSGLNASSEGELKAFYAHIKGYQEKTLQGPLHTILRVLQLNLDGEIDDSITFEFVDLWELDDEAKARVRASNAQTASAYVQSGVLDPEDERDRLEQEEDGLYFGVKLKEPEPEDYGAGPDGPDDDPEGEPEPVERASDAKKFDASKHPRRKDGKFGEGGKGAEAKVATGSASYQDLDKSLRQRWSNIGVLPSRKTKRLAQEYSESADYKRRWAEGTPDSRKEMLKEKLDVSLREGLGSKPGDYIKHVDVDLENDTPDAREQRAMLGHFKSALEYLESQGYDINKATHGAEVSYAPGFSPKNLHGYSLFHTDQAGVSRGFLTLNHKALTAEKVQSLINEAKADISRGERPETVTALLGATAPSGKERERYLQAIAIHELAHAIGRLPHINSPDRLKAILDKMFPDKEKQEAWIRSNISPYAAAPIEETDAELAALVTSPYYQRGTLPKELEDHVDAFFHRKAR